MENTQTLPMSVIIATRNRSDYLLSTLSDLLNQTHLPDEIIVVDQSSYFSQDFKQKILEMSKKGNIIYKVIRIRGASVARNYGISLARNKVLLFVDDDIKAPPDLCWRHYQYYQLPYKYDAISGLMLDPTCERQMTLPKYYFWPHVGWMFQPLAYGLYLDNFNLSTCNASVRRAAALAINGFDENFERWEDTDFAWRLHTSGARIAHMPDVWVIHLLAPKGAARYTVLPINTYVLGRRERWADTWYLCLKNFGIFRGWRIIWFWLRGLVFRRVLLWRPHFLLLAITEVILGLLSAIQRLRIGPQSILSKSSNLVVTSKDIHDD